MSGETDLCFAPPRRAAAFVSRSVPIDALVQTCLEAAAGKMVFPFLDIRELRNDPITTLIPQGKACP